MFNLFSGRAVKNVSPASSSSLIPIEEAIGYALQYSRDTADLIPIECGVCSKKNDKKKKGTNVNSRMPELIPIEQPVRNQRLPELIPIEQPVRNQRLPELVPIEQPVRNQRLPELIPISHYHAPLDVPSFDDLSEPIWVDDCPNLMDFLKK
jgi:hypothetical protein